MFMKHLLPIILFASLPVALYAQKAAPYKTYTDAKHGLSMQYPSTWASRTVEGTVLFLSRPVEEAGQKFTENVNLIIDPPDDLDLDEYGTVARERLPKQLTNYKELNVEKVKLGGRDYIRITYTFDFKNLKMHDVYYVMVYKNCSYNFSCSALETTYKKFFPVFEKMIGSFRVK